MNQCERCVCTIGISYFVLVFLASLLHWPGFHLVIDELRLSLEHVHSAMLESSRARELACRYCFSATNQPPRRTRFVRASRWLSSRPQELICDEVL